MIKVAANTRPASPARAASSTARPGFFSLTSVPLTAETLKKADCVVVVTDHAAVDYQLIARHARATVDTRHVLPRAGPRA